VRFGFKSVDASSNALKINTDLSDQAKFYKLRLVKLLRDLLLRLLEKEKKEKVL